MLSLRELDLRRNGIPDDGWKNSYVSEPGERASRRVSRASE